MHQSVGQSSCAIINRYIKGSFTPAAYLLNLPTCQSISEQSPGVEYNWWMLGGKRSIKIGLSDWSERDDMAVEFEVTFLHEMLRKFLQAPSTMALFRWHSEAFRCSFLPSLSVYCVFEVKMNKRKRGSENSVIIRF